MVVTTLETPVQFPYKLQCVYSLQWRLFSVGNNTGFSYNRALKASASINPTTKCAMPVSRSTQAKSKQGKVLRSVACFLGMLDSLLLLPEEAGCWHSLKGVMIAFVLSYIT